MTFLYKKHTKFPDKILIREFQGQVNSAEIIRSWEYMLENKLITSELLGVINDLSGCVLNMNMEGFQDLLNFLKKHGNIKKLKQAVISDTPGNIVFPTLAEIGEKELKIKVFSTIEAAVYWILF